MDTGFRFDFSDGSSLNWTWFEESRIQSFCILEETSFAKITSYLSHFDYTEMTSNVKWLKIGSSKIEKIKFRTAMDGGGFTFLVI